MRVTIHREGTGILIIILLVLLLVNILLWVWLKCSTVPIVVTLISAVFFFFAMNFFRSPRRRYSGDRSNVVVASADGKVVALERTFENEFLHREAIQVSVFMSVFNVHANWFPVDGKVIYAKHHSGRYQAAYLPKSSAENERSTVVIHTPQGHDVVVRQIAGALARRVVTYAKMGIDASIEDHLGFIKFGSRVDIFLPLDTEIYLKIGDKTIGGITEVGRLKPIKEDDKTD